MSHPGLWARPRAAESWSQNFFQIFLVKVHRVYLSLSESIYLMSKKSWGLVLALLVLRCIEHQQNFMELRCSQIKEPAITSCAFNILELRSMPETSRKLLHVYHRSCHRFPRAQFPHNRVDPAAKRGMHLECLGRVDANMAAGKKPRGYYRYKIYKQNCPILSIYVHDCPCTFGCSLDVHVSDICSLKTGQGCQSVIQWPCCTAVHVMPMLNKCLITASPR